jgi:PAS domain S-box-containing protein
VLSSAVPIASAQERTEAVSEASVVYDSDQLLQSILHTAPSGIGLVVDRKIIDVNEYVAFLTGYSRNELLGKDARMLYPSDADYEYVGTEKYRQIAEKGSGTVETKWRHKDGRTLHIILSSTPLDPADLSKGVVFTVHDIGDRVAAETALRNRTNLFIVMLSVFVALQLFLIAFLSRILGIRKQLMQTVADSRRMLLDVIDTIPVRVFWKDTQSRYLGCNRLFAGDAGKSDPAAVIGFDDADLAWVEQAEAYRAEDIRVLDTGAAIVNLEKPQFDPNGSTQWLRTSKIPLRDTQGKVYGLLGVYEDITESKRTEELLRKQDAELRVLNETLEERIGARTRELNGLNGDLRRANAELRSTLNALKETQDTLLQSEKLAALGQLVAGIAHELNTPLGAIASSTGSLLELIEAKLAFASRAIARFPEDVMVWFDARLPEVLSAEPVHLGAMQVRKLRKALSARIADAGLDTSDDFAETVLEMNLDQDPELLQLLARHPETAGAVESLAVLATIRRIAGIIGIASEKASGVVRALLYHVHREENTEKTAVDIPKEIDNILTLYGNQLKDGIALARNYRSDGVVEGNRNKLNQVWLNLIRNALQAMDYRGKLTIGVESKDGQVEVTVKDSGPGIPDHIKGRIFEPFFTTKKKGEGSGLGLDICRSIVVSHRGSIDFESGPGGTVFRVRLPISVDLIIP